MRTVSITGLGLCLFATVLPGPALQAQRQAPPFLFPDGIVFDVAISKDGKHMALACEDKAVRLYDCKTGKLLRILGGHNLRVWSIAFSPDGKKLACCTGEYREPGQPGEIKIWDLASGKPERSIAGHRCLIFCIAYSPDGNTLFSGAWDGSLKAWDLQDGTEKGALIGHRGAF